MTEESISLESRWGRVRDLEEKVEALETITAEQGEKILYLQQQIISNSGDIVDVKRDLAKLDQVDANTSSIEGLSTRANNNARKISDLNGKLDDAHRKVDEKVSKKTHVFIRRNVGDKPYLNASTNTKRVSLQDHTQGSKWFIEEA